MRLLAMGPRGHPYACHVREHVHLIKLERINVTNLQPWAWTSTGTTPSVLKYKKFQGWTRILRKFVELNVEDCDWLRRLGRSRSWMMKEIVIGWEDNIGENFVMFWEKFWMLKVLIFWNRGRSIFSISKCRTTGVRRYHKILGTMPLTPLATHAPPSSCAYLSGIINYLLTASDESLIVTS